MKQKLFLLSIIVFSFIITGCSRNNSLAYDESIQVQKEENKLDNNMDRIKDLKNSIYKFITTDQRYFLNIFHKILPRFFTTLV